MERSRRYCLITPCRDEALYARRTLDAVTQQTVPPALWVIVDDGSTDQTPAILAEYAQRFGYIRIVRRINSGQRRLGAGVMEAFYAGYETIKAGDFDYLCKLDLDLDLPRDYFERVMQRMEAEPRLGTLSGKPYFRKGESASQASSQFPIITRRNGFISEMCGDENSVGMIKFYRAPSFEQIGGFVRALMWDGIDGHRCRMNGWIAASVNDPELRFEHLRPMGTSHKSWWEGRRRHGAGQYFMGTTPAYMIASAVYRMTRPPVILGGVAMLWGYFASWFKNADRYDDDDFRHFLRRYQWRCLLMGKTRATRALNKRQATVWGKPPLPLKRSLRATPTPA